MLVERKNIKKMDVGEKKEYKKKDVGEKKEYKKDVGETRTEKIQKNPLSVFFCSAHEKRKRKY